MKYIFSLFEKCRSYPSIRFATQITPSLRTSHRSHQGEDKLASAGVQGERILKIFRALRYGCKHPTQRNRAPGEPVPNRVEGCFASFVSKMYRRIRTGSFILLLSWLYAACSQIIIPLPFNIVPLSLQPAPLFIATFFFGWQAVSAYWIYLIQGACGLPFFSRFGGGLAHLLGPTGGYLIGWGLAMMFIAWARTWARASFFRTIVTLSITCIMYFACGLYQLALFVPVNKVLICGLYPFLIGDVLIKPAIIISALRRKIFIQTLLNKPRK